MTSLRTASRSARPIVSAVDGAVYAALRARQARTELAWKAARVRGLGPVDSLALARAVEAGTVQLDAAEVAAEVEALIGTLRLHEACKSYVRTYGAPSYTGVAPGLCEGCARPMGCGAGGGAHAYRELSAEECRARGLYHAGRRYHVSVCDGCGHVEAVDSSD